MTLAAFLLFGTACVPQISQDAQIIQASMLQFFKKSDWNAPDWSRGELVVVDPKWRTDQRTSFDKTLKSIIGAYAKEPKAKKDLKILHGIQWGAGISSEGHEDPKLRPLSELGLSRPVILGQLDYGKERIRIWRPDKFKVKGPKAPPGEARTVAHLEPPGYSWNGRYAVVIANAPWSIHSADVHFFLKRMPNGWEVILVCPIFFA